MDDDDNSSAIQQREYYQGDTRGYDGGLIDVDDDENGDTIPEDTGEEEERKLPDREGHREAN